MIDTGYATGRVLSILLIKDLFCHIIFFKICIQILNMIKRSHNVFELIMLRSLMNDQLSILFLTSSISTC